MGILNVDFFKTAAEFEAVMKRQMLLKTVFYKRLFGGKGMEFDSFRRYSEKDDASLIDWKATAKAREPLVRQYIQERDIKIFVLVDCGDNMVFGSGDKLKIERAAEIAGSIAHLVLVSGDSVGYALYSDKIKFMKNFAGGNKQFYHLIQGFNNSENYGNSTSLKHALDFIAPRLKDVNAVFIISDFINVDDETLETLRKFAGMHETIGIMVRDVVDDALPDIKNEVAIEDPATGEQVVIKPDLIKNMYAKINKENKENLKNFLNRKRVSLFENYSSEDFILPFARFLKTRARKGREK